MLPAAPAGVLALAVMMFPTIMRTTEEILRLVPTALREAALALGDTHWHSILKVVLSTARGGVILVGSCPTARGVPPPPIPARNATALDASMARQPERARCVVIVQRL